MRRIVRTKCKSSKADTKISVNNTTETNQKSIGLELFDEVKPLNSFPSLSTDDTSLLSVETNKDNLCLTSIPEGRIRSNRDEQQKNIRNMELTYMQSKRSTGNCVTNQPYTTYRRQSTENGSSDDEAYDNDEDGEDGDSNSTLTLKTEPPPISSQRISALIAALAKKQCDITGTLCSIIERMKFLVEDIDMEHKHSYECQLMLEKSIKLMGKHSLLANQPAKYVERLEQDILMLRTVPRSISLDES